MSTIGVSIAVPDPWGPELQDYRCALGDTTAAHIPTHITLLPPLEIGADDLAGIDDHLAEVAAGIGGFGLHLRGTGTFRPVSPVVFVNVVAGIARCEQLTHAVRRGPLVTEARFPYHPHVTVAHDLPDEVLDRAFEELAGFECAFEVEEFWLYVHDATTGWQPTRSFALG